MLLISVITCVKLYLLLKSYKTYQFLVGKEKEIWVTMDIKTLVVDDNEVNTLVLTNMLKTFGIHADQAGNGIEAVKISQKVSYNLFFIDHIMPEMNGIQTTMQLRKLSGNETAIIIALTSKTSENIKEQYLKAGADDLFEKPLSLNDLTAILKKYFPQLHIDISNANICYGGNELIQSIIETIDDIDYQAGLRYAIYNPHLYIHILEVSLKDIQSCMNIIVKSHLNNSAEELRLGVHKLCNIYNNIGAVTLALETRSFEKDILLHKPSLFKDKYEACIRNLENLYQKLKWAVDRYQASLHNQLSEDKMDFTAMTDSEYEQCLKNTIYYIKRYEYDSIKKELDNLIRRGFTDDRTELMQAYKDIMNYDYEKALSELLVLKNKTGDSPV